MPSWGRIGLLAALFGLLAGCANTPPEKARVARQMAPAEPGAELLEFVGEWTELERELLNAEVPAPATAKPAKAKSPEEAPHGR